MKKVAIFAFQGEGMCFMHVLLNALDMKEKGYDVKLVIEGAATGLVPNLSEKSNPYANLYEKVREAGLIDCVCRACATKMGALDAALSQKLSICDELSGHPSMARYLDAGYGIITF